MAHNILISTFLLLVFSIVATAQPSDLEVNISMDADFSQDDLSEMLSAVIEQNGSSQFFRISAENQSSGIMRNNSVTFVIRSEKFGTILTAEQTSSGFFSLNPGGQITFSNLSISDISNLEIKGEPDFNLLISSNGRKLIQNLRRGYLITDDRYTLDVILVQNIMDEREEISRSSVSFETTLDERELAIEADREVVAELIGLNVSKEAPEFAWSGDQGRPYRLVIVDLDRAQNANNLFSERFESEHSEDDIRDEQAGVVLDVVANETRYQIPDRFAGLFEPGKTYAWQVQTTKKTVEDSSVQSYTNRLEFTAFYPIEGEVRELLIKLFGEEKTEQFIEDELLLDQIVIDGETYSKRDALLYLREMADKMELNKLKIAS
ncbi:hypothetical protein [Rhodohalobacter barkolensis]|uniref:Uncharacterized protein n=1 Tax=Rhodohalobacter barkolensis TaxID=2053187 RepID=A0A2N0VI32_9BACT|nr:hypothetical protein [Rhodohalobacter barkolensis]PKD43842.1 hypothetical protein CWD77_09815 [Rhodohalobacter barkolensis]